MGLENSQTVAIPINSVRYDTLNNKRVDPIVLGLPKEIGNPPNFPPQSNTTLIVPTIVLLK